MPTSQEQMASLLPAMMAAMAAELIAAANSAQQHVSLPSNEQQQSVESPFDSSQATGEIKKKCRISRKRGIDEVKVKGKRSLSTPIPEPNIEVVDSADPLAAVLIPAALPHQNSQTQVVQHGGEDRHHRLRQSHWQSSCWSRVQCGRSSIREWRKNEDRLRRQMEQGVDGVITQTAHQFEKENSQVIAQIDEVWLVQFINEHSQSADWYAVRDKAAEIWAQMANGSVAEMNISMGWVARFMARSERLIPKLAPPIIATSNALNGTTASLSMVRCSNKDAEEGEHGATLLTTSSTVPSAPQQTSPAKEKPEMENSQMEKMSSMVQKSTVVYRK
uniref:HTH CENPB-type domain-containing protein n=1 Tax=Ditylenchus dipsaci TaxID=166011 RepID=A0A915D6Z1_9BILA